LGKPPEGTAAVQSEPGIAVYGTASLARAGLRGRATIGGEQAMRPDTKRSLWGAVVAVAVAAMMTTLPSGAVRADDKDVTIGMLLAMTGPGITYGKVMSQGAMLAVEQINAAGGVDGKKLKLEIGDHKSGEAKAGVSEMERLVNVYKVPVVLSSFSAPTLAAQAIAVQSNTLLINGGGWSPALVGKQLLWNTRLTGDTTAQATAGVAWDDGVRSLCMVYRQDPSGIDTAAVVRKYWEGRGGKVLCEEKYDLNTTNFGSQIAKVRSSKPDALMIFSYGQQNGTLVKQARDYGYSGPIYGLDYLPENVTVAGAAMEGYKFAIDEFDINSKEPISAKFVAAYRARFKEDPDFYAANYYEATYIVRDLIAALDKAGKPTTGSNLDAEIRQMRSFPSVYGGKITFRDNGTAQKPIAVFEIKNGQKVLIKKLS
jgi:branched-chain amino acid transport system substrate-binding protein